MAGLNIVHVHHPLTAARLLEWRHIQDFSCYFKTDNKRMHSLTSWVSEQGDNEFNVCSSEEHPRVLTGPQMEISHPALFALVGVSPVLLADWGWKNLWANPGDSRLSLLWAQRRETIPRTPRSWRETIPPAPPALTLALVHTRASRAPARILAWWHRARPRSAERRAGRARPREGAASGYLAGPGRCRGRGRGSRRVPGPRERGGHARHEPEGGR